MAEPIPQCGKEQDHRLATANLPPGCSPEEGLRVLDSLSSQRGRTREFKRLDNEARRARKKENVLQQALELVRDARTEYGSRMKTVMGTLTYRDADGYRPNDVQRFNDKIERRLKRMRIRMRGVWVSELGEKRGRFHYHFVLYLPKGKNLTKEHIQECWPHGFVHLLKHDPKKSANPVAYLAKYLAKAANNQCRKKYPKRARVNGACGLTKAAKRNLRWKALPSSLREKTTPEDDVRPRRGGGRVARRTGEFFPAEWRRVWRNGWLGLERVKAAEGTPPAAQPRQRTPESETAEQRAPLET